MDHTILTHEWATLKIADSEDFALCCEKLAHSIADNIEDEEISSPGNCSETGISTNHGLSIIRLIFLSRKLNQAESLAGKLLFSTLS